MKNFILFLVASLTLSLSAYTQEKEVNAIATIFKTGNTEELPQYLAGQVSIGLNKSEKSYSRVQAHQVIKSFLNRHTPIDFIYRHSGNSDKRDQFNVGLLKTERGDFRLTYFLIETERGFKIKRLRIEPK
ncbi:DUF4783 domain-containing protein [Luteibaculum oceani]|uniref:DUF4783 domain-containing protein n=1 Tax=Luteibaculum oceani TaxID=1294296 RepID=A0A5C6V8U7_9FLAO|nr:DUF4783 domain-containing protein [Luteibaculum oceani]TXC81519.1 DUF4783 domain-containing protein [Luteibaculum oceani]